MNYKVGDIFIHQDDYGIITNIDIHHDFLKRNIYRIEIVMNTRRNLVYIEYISGYRLYVKS